MAKKSPADAFDPPQKPAPFEPQASGELLVERAEMFISFVRRCFGTSKTAPLCIEGGPINGASIDAITKAFIACHPVSAGGLVPGSIQDRRRALEAKTAETAEAEQ